MSDEAALLAAIRAHPDEDTPRLMYADWLDENGRGARAEFIRVQVELALLHSPDGHVPECYIGGCGPADEGEVHPCKACGPVWALRERERELWTGGALFHILDHGRAALPPETVVHLGADRPSFVPSRPEAYVARGFVAEVTCTAADWLAHADAVLAAHPVRRVAWTRFTWRDRGELLARIDQLMGERAACNGMCVTDIAAEVWKGVEFELLPGAVPATNAGLYDDTGAPGTGTFGVTTGPADVQTVVAPAAAVVEKRFGVDFNSPGGALTLAASDVSETEATGLQERTHADGWTIRGEVHEDYFYWVNDFDASHPQHGRVWGNFEDVVFATSEAAYQHFWQHHAPSAWDYHDI